MVVSYSYLWKHETETGETEGRKNRPAAIVVTSTEAGLGEMVYVVPITHRPPAKDDSWKILIPQTIKQRLGLDEEKSWIDVSEMNVFTWSGYHLSPTKRGRTPDQETCLYGYLPSRFFNSVRKALHECHQAKKLRLVPR